MRGYFNEEPAGGGTAFFWAFAEQLYLVTAWHVITGRHWQTGENLARQTAIHPNKLRVWWNPQGAPGGAKQPHDLELRGDHDEPLWLELPGRAADVALLPVQTPVGAEPYPINELPEGAVDFGMGQDLFILGFPMIDQPLKLPIWKRASLASEPEIPEAIQPYWLVDTASRSGMSGAPVIQRSYNYDLDIRDLTERLRNPGHRGKSSFVGVYSGRFKLPPDIEDDERDHSTSGRESSGAPVREPEDFHLGIVWPIQWIMRLVRDHVGQDAYDAELKRQSAAMGIGTLANEIQRGPQARG